MSRVRVGVCQLLVGTEKAANVENAVLRIGEVVKQGAQLVVLPECFNCPYATDQFKPYGEAIPSVGESFEESKHPTTFRLSKTAAEHGVYLVGGSIPEIEGDKVYNTCTVYDPEGTLIAKHRKVHLFDIDIPGKMTFKESETLSAGDSITTVDTPYGKIGIGICYDMRFPQLALAYRDSGCSLLVYPGAFNTTTGPLHWELLQRGRAVDNQAFVITASPCRNPDSKYQAWGHSTIVDPWGAIVATTEHEAATFVADLDLGQVETVRKQIPIMKQERLSLYPRKPSKEAMEEAKE